ncbi:MAG TPA: Crp/Fnr family transcriptional regulator, partial [Candidatus Saccharimonadia bacterium]|nr:Crp/Fnr family transcriptional regulator [Candidatus Saccharimonadia bacterium]
YYEAFTDTEAYALSYEIVRKFLHDHPDMLLVVSDLLTKAYVNSIGQVENLEKSHIHERLEYVLYTLAARLGTNAGSVARIDALITQEDLARLAGVTRESMSLEMNRHRSRGLMWKKGNSTYIDVGRLDVASMPKFYAI